SEIQAGSILEMRLQRLTGLEREKIINELEELIKRIDSYKHILSDQNLVMKIIRDEFEEIKEKYGDERRTEIIEVPDEILPEDMIPVEDMVITVTHAGYIKRNNITLYHSQRRGGKGVKGIKTISEDFVNDLHLASTHDTFMFFTNHGKVFWRKVYEIPQASRIATGKAIVNLLGLAEGEKVAAILPVHSFEVPEGQKCHVFMATKKGVVKKTVIQEFQRPFKKGKIALKIRENDEIISAALTSGNDDVLLVTRNGMSIKFNEKDIRSMGRTACGVRGIRLFSEEEGKNDDEVVGSVVLTSDSSVLTVTENGYGKRSSVDDYRIQKRGGKGIFAIKASKRNGKIVGAVQVNDEDEIMLITNGGKIIRMNMEHVRVIGRNTQGVRLINLNKDEKVVGMDRLAETYDDHEEVEEPQ
ncbi:MAG: DNA gyrase C-terminal beta-propeller domain-containing protein, partial [Thermodesulfobacteriota bacterium]|nr:DNA gyrase C-terminal beta-propeller domain-containing protein [Thermodesulfobacteriota bacterium]